jgi:putative transposase
MGTRRFVYNKALEKIKKNEEKLNFYTLRNKLVTAKNNPDINEWELETPKDIRAGAIRDMIKNHKTAFSNLKNNNIKGFKMGFCSKKDIPSIEIPKSALKLDKGLFIYKSYLPEKIKVGRREKMNFSFDYDCRLQLKNNQWFLLVPIKTTASKIEDRLGYCSLDPGVRNFQTIYSEEMIVQVKIRKELIKKLQIKLDHFQSLRDKKTISRYRFRRKERRIYTRINNLIDDLHHKTCSFLTKTFNHIILPIFESQKMTKRYKIRGLNRDLLQLKHFLFRERLKAKCELRQCSLDICTEEFTSKTCGLCGKCTSVEGEDVFTCDYCNLVVDRDVNGARNIAIKRLNELF